MSFGAYLRTKRNNRGLTLEHVAHRIGLSVPHLSRIERDKENPPRREIIHTLAETIGIPVEDLLVEAKGLSPDAAHDPGDVFALYRRANRGRTR